MSDAGSSASISYAYQLSGGLRQRAMIAMALSCKPTLLIADEPTTALDVTTQAQILELMRRLQQEDGMAIMLITHDLGVIAEMADDVVVMYLGRVVEQAPVDAIFHDPKHPYTQALLRSIPSIRSRTRERLTPIAGSVPHPYNRPTGCPFHPRCPEFMLGHVRPRDARAPRRRRPSRRVAASCTHDGTGAARGTAPSRLRALQKLFPIQKGFFKRTVGHVRAVDDVDFHIDEGETLGLVGESGCGKTTTARCILRAIEPTAGEVRIRTGGGKVVDDGRLCDRRSCARCGARCR